jgi:peptidoglycan/LPS O-acetylase OafA/YrhL
MNFGTPAPVENEKSENNAPVIINRIKTLDSFRGIAALSVLFFHIAHFKYGHFGVQFFFIISGFVIFHTIERCKTITEFACKRFFRLYPTYWVCLSITTITIIAYNYGHSGVNRINAGQFLVNITMVQELFGVENIDLSYWSLLPELFFYLFMGSIFIFRLLDKILIIGIAWLLLIVCNALFDFESYFPFVRLLNIRHGQLFLAGILLFKLYSGYKSYLIKISLCACYLTSVLVYSKVFTFAVAAIAMTIIFSLFLLFLQNRVAFLENRILQFIGLISYPLYLIHQKIGSILLDVFTPVLGEVATVVLAVIIFIFSAYFLHKLVEVPSARLTRRVLQFKHT